MSSVVRHERFTGVFWALLSEGRKRLATLNLTPGRRYYDEELVEHHGAEYRLWNPFRSKISAAMLNNVSEMPISSGTALLYLGVATGTTCSHLSDIIGEHGMIYGVDFAPRPMRDFVENLANYRENVSPILADARNPLSYRMFMPKVDVVYSDVAQPNQAQILADNADLYLCKGGWGLLAIKSQSIDVTEEPSAIYERETEFLEHRNFTIIDRVNLEPYEKDHAFVVAKFAGTAN